MYWSCPANVVDSHRNIDLLQRHGKTVNRNVVANMVCVNDNNPHHPIRPLHPQLFLDLGQLLFITPMQYNVEAPATQLLREPFPYPIAGACNKGPGPRAAAAGGVKISWK